MGADQSSSRGVGRPRTSQNPGTARGELARWLREVADREPKVLNAAIAAHAGITGASVGRAMRGETFASTDIVAAVVELGNVTERERREHAGWVTALAEFDARHGRTIPDALPPPPWTIHDHADPHRPRRRRRSIWMVTAVAGIVALAMAGVLALVVRQPPAAAPTYVEQVANPSGTPTFADPVKGSGATGPRIPARTFVEVSCKVYAPIFASVSPDGFWYRIESSPWNGKFYAVANTFANGDLPGANPATNTDRAVPDC